MTLTEERTAHNQISEDFMEVLVYLLGSVLFVSFLRGST
jgi:hypothetical protein